MLDTELPVSPATMVHHNGRGATLSEPKGILNYSLGKLVCEIQTELNRTSWSPTSGLYDGNNARLQ